MSLLFFFFINVHLMSIHGRSPQKYSYSVCSKQHVHTETKTNKNPSQYVRRILITLHVRSSCSILLSNPDQAWPCRYAIQISNAQHLIHTAQLIHRHRTKCRDSSNIFTESMRSICFVCVCLCFIMLSSLGTFSSHRST